MIVKSRSELMALAVDGRLPRYTSIGCYPLIYLVAGGDALCASCASDSDDWRDWKAAVVDVHWEGDPVTCDECGEDIESAYGPIEE